MTQIALNEKFDTAVKGIAKELKVTPEIMHKFYDDSPQELIDVYNAYNDASGRCWKGGLKSLVSSAVGYTGVVLMPKFLLLGAAILVGGLSLGREWGIREDMSAQSDALNPVREKLGFEF